VTRLSLPRTTALALLLGAAAGCADAGGATAVAAPAGAPMLVQAGDEAASRVVVDAAITQGPVIRFERASTHSTSSPLPGEPTRAYMQGLDLDVVRTGVQVRYGYNKGNVDYNYRYEGSGVGAEDALAFYATTGKSILIALSAYNPTSTWPMPQGEALVDFLRETLVYYKQKYPNVRYIQVGNEPDAADETMATYYPMYRAYYRAVNGANEALKLKGDDRILISNGPFTSNVTNMVAYANGFFAAFAADPDTTKRLDFFSFHSYGETDRPAQLRTARERIHAAMAAHGIAPVPVFVSEYGLFGGSSLPVRMSLDSLMTMQPAGMLTKAFYLYEGGADAVFNWAIHHRTLPSKSQVADVATGVLYPYGNMLKLAHMLSARETRIAATSRNIVANGLGTHAVAAMAPGKGLAILVWNYHWRQPAAAKDFTVHVKNMPHEAIGGQRVKRTIYLVDRDHNNSWRHPEQASLEPLSVDEVRYSDAMTIPLSFQSGVALIVLEHARAR
jgi:hypothetical protein